MTDAELEERARELAGRGWGRNRIGPALGLSDTATRRLMKRVGVKGTAGGTRHETDPKTCAWCEAPLVRRDNEGHTNFVTRRHCDVRCSVAHRDAEREQRKAERAGFDVSERNTEVLRLATEGSLSWRAIGDRFGLTAQGARAVALNEARRQGVSLKHRDQHGSVIRVAMRAGVSADEVRRRKAAGERWCGRCGQWLPVADFGAQTAKRSGRQSYCTECARANQRAKRFGRDDVQPHGVGECECCGRMCDGTRGKHDYVVTDHDHGTNELRGRLCFYCNSALGLLGDDPDAAARGLARYARLVRKRREAVAPGQLALTPGT